MTRLFAQKDAGLAALLARLAPLEERLAAVEARPRDPARSRRPSPEPSPTRREAAGAAAEAEAARAEARAVAGQLALVQAAAEASAERAALFADRISGLEASLPRLSAAEVRAMAAAGAEPGAAAGGSRGRCPPARSRCSRRCATCRGWSRSTRSEPTAGAPDARCRPAAAGRVRGLPPKRASRPAEGAVTPA